MTVRIYTHHDAAGPKLTLSGNALDKLLQILVPCLVNGYAGKPAAGWSLAQSLSNSFTLGRASGGLLNFTKSASNTSGLMVYLLESITNAGTAPPAGQNLRSYSYSASSNSTETNRHWIRLNDASTVRGWLLAANAESFILQVRVSDSLDDVAATNVLTFFGGAAKLHSALIGVQNFFAMTGAVLPVTYSGNSFNNEQFEVGCTVLRDPLTGSVIPGASGLLIGHPGMLQSQLTSWISTLPDAWPPNLRLSPLHLRSANSFVGSIPGVLTDQILCHYQPTQVMAALGFTPTLESWTAPKIVGGISVWPLTVPWGLLFVTDDAGYW